MSNDNCAITVCDTDTLSIVSFKRIDWLTWSNICAILPNNLHML